MDGRERRELARALAEPQGDVVSRSQLAAVGVSRHDIRSEARAERWRVLGTQTVGTSQRDLAQLPMIARCGAGVWETGASITAVDGVTALWLAGLVGYSDDDVQLSVVHRHDADALQGARVHKVIRRVPGELVQSGLPRTRPEVAAVRAAHWARTDRQAALILLMTVLAAHDTAATGRGAAHRPRAHPPSLHPRGGARHRVRGREPA